MMGKDGVTHPLVIPDHKELSIKVLKNNLGNAGIAEANFITAMRKPKKRASSG